MYLSNNVPVLFHPNHLGHLNWSDDTNCVSVWNYTYKQYTTFKQNMDVINRSGNLNNRRNFVSQYHPTDLIDLPYCHSGDMPRGSFGALTYYMSHESFIELNCAELFICTYLLGSVHGRITIRNGNHFEAPVLQSICFANSGRRKSLLHNRLFAPVMEFENRIKNVYNENSGLLSKQVNKSAPAFLAKALLKNVDLCKPDSISEVFERAREMDQYYKSLPACESTPPNINITNITPYKLARLMSENGEAQTIFSAEGSSASEFLLHKDRDLGLKSFGQESYTYSKGNQHFELAHPALNIAIFAQPDIAKKLYGSSSLLSAGTTARILPHFNIRKEPQSYSPNGDEDYVYKLKINQLFQNFFTREKAAKRFTIDVEQSGSILLDDFRKELDTWIHGIDSLKPWVAKLHGQALRIALAIHLWNHTKDPLSSEISKYEVMDAIGIAKFTANHAYFLFSPYGLIAAMDAIRILHSLQRISGEYEQPRFLNYGLTTTQLQQRNGIDRIRINNALNLLSWRGWVAISDDGSGNLQMLPHLHFFNMPVDDI